LDSFRGWLEADHQSDLKCEIFNSIQFDNLKEELRYGYIDHVIFGPDDGSTMPAQLYPLWLYSKEQNVSEDLLKRCGTVVDMFLKKDQIQIEKKDPEITDDDDHRKK
jgi:hypothetical protein